MSVRTDVINLNVNINGNVAQNQLNDLRKRAADIASEMKGLKKGTQEYIDANKELSAVTGQMNALKQSIGITSLSQKELTAELRKLTAMKGSMQPFTKEFKDVQVQIDAVNKRLYDVRNGVTGLRSVFSKVGDSVKQFGVIAAGYLGFQFITSQFQNIIKGAGKMSDQLADLRRVTGLTAEETDNLSAALKKIDTRTANSSLRDIAIIAGKLGVAKEDVFGFTKAVDQLVVSLGDELGNADQITTQLGKILNVFDGKITGDNITRLGNAFVELANSGAATGGFIAEFDQRLSGIAKSAGIGLGALSGLGAGLEEMGSRVESSTTAIQKLIINISGNVPKAAQVAGKSLDEFRKTLKFDPTEAILQYSQGLVKNKASFEEVVASFKDAGEEGARVVETISKLGTGADKLRERIDLGKKSIQESSAITEAFALKNENFGATLDKLGKQFDRFVTSNGMISFLKGLVEGFASVLKILTSIPAPLIKLALSFGSLVVAIALFNSGMIQAARLSLINAAATLKNTIVINAQAAAIVLSRLATSAAIATQAAYIVVTNLLTGAIGLATAATRLWSIAIKTGLGPIGLLLVAVGAIAGGINALSNAFKTSTKAASLHTETLKQANAEIAEQQSKISTLVAVIKDKTLAEGTHKKALEDLIAISPEYLSGLTLQNIALTEGKRILDDYNTALQTSANLKAASALKDKEFQKNVELRSTQQELIIAEKAGKGFGDLSEAAQNAFSKVKTSVGRTAFMSDLLNTIPSSDDFKEAFKNIQDQIDKSTEDVNLSTDNYLQKQKEKDDARQRFLLHQVTVNRQAMLQFQKGSEEFNVAQKKYLDSIDKYNSEFNKSGKSTMLPTIGGIDAASVAARRAKLEELIEQSKADFEKLNIADKAGQAANLALRQKYQDELDALDGKEKKAASKKGNYAQLLKEAEAFYKSIQKLKQDAINASKSDDERELLQIQQKYQELQAKALDYFKKNLTSRGKYNEEVKMLQDAFNLELSALQKKQFDKTSADEYADSLKASDDYFAEKKRQVERDYAEGKIDKDEYEKSLTSIEALATKNRLIISNDYSATVKKAAEDNKNFIIAQEELITKNLLHQKELREAFSQEESKATRDIRSIQINDPATSPKQRANLKKQNATDDKNAGLANLKEKLKDSGKAFDDASVNATEQGKAIWDEFNLTVKEADQELIDSKIKALDFFAQFAEQRLGDLFTALNNLDQRALQKDKAINDAKKNNYKKQLDAKLLSQKQYDKKVAAADAEMDKKKQEADLKAFKRQQALSITTALINGALAVTSTLAARPGMSDLDTFGISRAVQVALVIAATAAQVAAIATQAPPEAAEGNWFRKGDKHKDPSGGIPVMIERDEAVMKADAMTDSNQYTVTGTPAQITSKLNSIHGGVNWADGATIQPKFRERPPQINPNMPRIMAEGGMGVVRQMNQAGASNDEVAALLRIVIAGQNEQTTEIKNQKERLHAVVSIKEYRETEKKYDNAKKASGMSQ